MRTILAIDPGREKCGLAVVTDAGIICKSVVSREEIVSVATSLVSDHSVEKIIVGNGTGADALVRELGSICPIEIVDEAFTSQKARVRFLKENPPKGIRRFIPRGLLIPDRPYDDYVAVILAETYLRRIMD